MTALEKMTAISTRRWFVALYRWTVVALVPFFTALGGWVLLQTYNGGVAMAQFTEQVAAVNKSVAEIGGRVDKLENANTQAIAARNKNDIDLASRMSRLETSNDNLSKAIDRLVRLLDDNPPARRAP